MVPPGGELANRPRHGSGTDSCRPPGSDERIDSGKGGGAPHWVDYDLGLIGSGGTLGTAHVLGGGLALAKQVLNQPGIAVSGFGDGTAQRGTFHETLLQAAAWKLPLLYFCENNGWAVGTSFANASPTDTDRGTCFRVRHPWGAGRRTRRSRRL